MLPSRLHECGTVTFGLFRVFASVIVGLLLAVLLGIAARDLGYRIFPAPSLYCGSAGLPATGELVMIGVANVFYFLGPISERIVRPHDPERYRRICFRLGFWFSVLLPFSIAALLVVLVLFHPSCSRHSA